MLEYGLPARIADRPETWPVFRYGTTRTTCIGVLMFIFYARGQYDVLDTFLLVTGGYLGAYDTWLVWREGNGSWGLFRLVSSWLLAAAGLVGFTQGG